MMPFLIALANMYLIGPLHFTNRLAFAAGSMLAFGLYWVSVVLLTLGVRQPIRYYPGMQQTVLRTLVMLGWVGSFTLILSIIYVSAYSLVSATKVAFSWTLVQSICIAGLLADAFLCIILGLSYTYSQWKVELQEDEQWQRQALQRQYDALKYIALVILPGIGALYFGIAQIWGLPKPGEVVGTITVIDTFLGVVLGLSSTAYKKSDAPYDGVMNVLEKPDGGLTLDLALNGSAEDLADQRAISFKVQKQLGTTELE